MTTRTRRTRSTKAQSVAAGIVEEGAERYIWVYPEGKQLVLAIPGLRGLKFTVDEARSVGEMLIQTVDEMTADHRNKKESEGKHGGSEEHPTER
jgi:hypothetical protein